VDGHNSNVPIARKNEVWQSHPVSGGELFDVINAKQSPFVNLIAGKPCGNSSSEKSFSPPVMAARWRRISLITLLEESVLMLASEI
jgi:hypothetical protein